MQAVVKMPDIEINVKGAVIPPKLIEVLREEYGKKLKLVKDDGEELIRISDTQWYKDMKRDMHPGRFLRVYRENKGLTQAALGELLGGIPRQHVSNMENGTRAISLKMARQLAKVLEAPIERFIEKVE